MEIEETKSKIEALTDLLLQQKDPLLGALLDGKIEIQERISAGGNGVVYKGFHRLMARLVAIKVLNGQADENSLKRFQQEARAAFDLRHDNIASVHDVGVTPQQLPYLVMDFVEGQSLAQLIESSKVLAPERALNLVAQACAGFQAAHEKGFIHRDIKPSNLMVVLEQGKETVKIVDFGIAKSIDSGSSTLTSTGQIVGSPPYMSPEQCSGHPVDGRCDIYSLGCTLFEALTGHPPFRGSNAVEVIMKHVTEPPPTLKSRGLKVWSMPGLENLIQGALCKDRSQRFQSMSEFGSAIKTVEFGGTLSTRVPSVRIPCVGLPIFAIALVGIAVSLLVFGWFALKPPVAQNSDPLSDAQGFDQLSYKYFTAHDYERAIPLLEFGIKTYRKNRNDFESLYLADNLQHIGKCYLEMNKPVAAAHYYQEALEIYQHYDGRRTMMSEAVNDYSRVLTKIGRQPDATVMLDEFRRNAHLSTVP